ncbi:PAS domain S-box protein, partial [candidate division KSB1 bacterium]
FLKLDLLSGKDIARAAKLLAKNMMGKSTGPDEFILKRKNGELIDIEIKTFPFKFSNRTFVLGVARDITERKKISKELRRAKDQLETRVEERTVELLKFNEELHIEILERLEIEKALKKSEENLRTIVDNINEIIFQLSPEGEIMYVSSKVREHFKYDPEDLIGKSFEYTTPASDIPKALEAIKEIVSGRWIKNLEISQLTKDKRTIPVEIDALPIKEKGKIVAIQGCIREISERKLAEKYLFESEQRFRELAELLPEVVYEIDKNGMATFVNKKIFEISGYSRDDFEQGFKAVNFLAPEERKRAEENINKLLNGKTVENDEYIALRKDGTTFPILIRSNPIYSENEITGLRGIILDMTYRKQAEEEKKRLEEQLFHAQKMESIGRLAGGIAHDFSNILGVIMGYADLLRLRFNDPDTKEGKAVNNIFRNAKRSKALISQLLTFARPSKFSPEPVYINKLIKDTIQVSEKMFEKKVVIRYNLSKDVKIVFGDRNQLDQVLTNIFINAKDAMPNGGILEIRSENFVISDKNKKHFHSLECGKYAKICISDDGIGMTKKIKNQIFEPFFTTKYYGKGTGLGLATVYGIIKNHDGFIEVESEKNEGSTFIIYLPISSKKIKLKSDAKDLIMGDARILVVDDEDDMRELMMEQLRLLGYSVVGAKDGLEAIKIYKKEKIDGVVLDLLMPKLSGEDTFVELRKLNPDVKVMIVSGVTQKAKSSEVLRKNIKEFLQKPFEQHELSRALNNVLDQN